MLHLDSNQFTGTIPSSLANLPLCKSTQSLVLIQVCPYSAHARRPPNFQRHSVLSDSNLTGTLDAFCGIDLILLQQILAVHKTSFTAYAPSLPIAGDPNFACTELFSTQTILSCYLFPVWMYWWLNVFTLEKQHGLNTQMILSCYISWMNILKAIRIHKPCIAK